METKRQRANVGAVYGMDGSLGSRDTDVFYQVKLPVVVVGEFRQLLTSAADPATRRWLNVTASYHDPNRLRVTSTEPPAYERRAGEMYLRGDVLRITGKVGNSINVDFSSRFAAAKLCEMLSQAQAKAKEFVWLRVPSRKRDLVELVPDVDIASARDSEMDRLAKAGAVLAAEVWGHEDFSDWEDGPDADSDAR